MRSSNVGEFGGRFVVRRVVTECSFIIENQGWTLDNVQVGATNSSEKEEKKKVLVSVKSTRCLPNLSRRGLYDGTRGVMANRLHVGNQCASLTGSSDSDDGNDSVRRRY